jgi:hypothetical protein
MNNQSSSDSSHSLGFPWFEEDNFSGWLIQFKAHLRRSDAVAPVLGPRPAVPLDQQGQPVALDQAQARNLVTNQSVYDKADNVAFSDLMKACRLNAKRSLSRRARIFLVPGISLVVSNYVSIRLTRSKRRLIWFSIIL